MVPPCTERVDDDDDAMVPLAPKPFNSKEFKLEEYPVLKRAIERWNVINEPKEANAGCALLKRIQDCAVGSGRCEMPRRENGKVTLTAGQVRAALCHAILCNATDPVGEQRWGSEVTKPANRSAGKEYGQSGGLVWNKFLGKTDVDGDGNKPNVDGDGKKPNVSPMAVQRALALLAYFEAATKENFDDKRRISFTLHEGDASLLTTLHNPPTQIKFPEVSVHHGDIDKETVLGSWYVKEIDKETVLRKDSALVNFANYVYGYGEMSKSKDDEGKCPFPLRNFDHQSLMVKLSSEQPLERQQFVLSNEMPVLLATLDCIARSHEGFLRCNGIMGQVLQGIRNAQNTSNDMNKFHGKMRFAKNSPRILGLNELADDGSFIVHWSRWDPVSNPLDWSTGLDHIVRELSDISIGQRLALQVNNATLMKKVDAGIKQLENALLTKKVVVAIAEERYPISSHDRIEEYSFLIIDVHSNPVELKAVHVMHEVELKAIPRACMTYINLFAMPT